MAFVADRFDMPRGADGRVLRNGGAGLTFAPALIAPRSSAGPTKQTPPGVCAGFCFIRIRVSEQDARYEPYAMDFARLARTASIEPPASMWW